jgi:hypothetical protein
MSRTIAFGSHRKSSRQSERTIRRHSQPIVHRDVTVIVRTICALNLSSWLPKITRPSRMDFHAVLGGFNALRFASTVRSARPAGVDPACAPLEFAIARWSRFDRD